FGELPRFFATLYCANRPGHNGLNLRFFARISEDWAAPFALLARTSRRVGDSSHAKWLCRLAGRPGLALRRDGARRNLVVALVQIEIEHHQRCRTEQRVETNSNAQQRD